MTKKSKGKGKLKVVRRSIRKIADDALKAAQGGLIAQPGDGGTDCCPVATDACDTEYCGHYTDTNISCQPNRCKLTIKIGGGASNHNQTFRR